MYLHGVEQSKHGTWELLGSWQKKEAEEQNKKKKHQGQDSSIAVLTMRRSYRIKLISDGSGGSQGIQPGRLTGKKKGQLGDAVIQICCSGFTHAISTS